LPDVSILGTAVVWALAGPAPASNTTTPHRTDAPLLNPAAVVRLGVLAGGGNDVMQPVGFGAGFQFRVFSRRIAVFRFGGELHLGHTRFLQRKSVAQMQAGQAATVKRWSALGHTEFALGPAVHVAMGPVFAELGVAAGLGISTLARPFGPLAEDEDRTSDTTAMIRGGGQLGIPIRGPHSLVIGAWVHRYFSREQVSRDGPTDPQMPVPPLAQPFDLMVEISIGYHYSFPIPAKAARK
jgi:hypothetical protein